MLYLCTFLLAFCSITYELLLGQTLSAFLGNTILRYSVTIGLYLSSMGLGALCLPRAMQKTPVMALVKVELALSIVGSFSVMSLLLAHAMGVEGLLFFALAHFMIVAIGVLTGYEIPLLVMIGNIERPDSEARTLGIDYLGAFLGTMLFAFFFYPIVGVIATSIYVGTLNAVVGLSLSRKKLLVEEENQTQFTMLLAILLVVFMVLCFAMLQLENIERLGMDMYLLS